MASRHKNPETLIQDEIRDWLNLRGIFVRRMQVGGMIVGSRMVENRTMKGFPDLWGVLGRTGRMFVIEVKTPTGKVTEDQIKWLTDLSEKGVVTIVARSLKDVILAFTAPGGLALRTGWQIEENKLWK